MLAVGTLAAFDLKPKEVACMIRGAKYGMIHVVVDLSRVKVPNMR
jgi:hypothetical protein